MVGGIELLDSTNLLSGLRYPFKFEKVTQIVITAGGLSCIVDFRSYTLKAPAMAIFRDTRKEVGGGKKKIVSLCYEYRYTTLLGKLDATNRYAYSL